MCHEHAVDLNVSQNAAGRVNYDPLSPGYGVVVCSSAAYDPDSIDLGICRARPLNA